MTADRYCVTPKQPLDTNQSLALSFDNPCDLYDIESVSNSSSSISSSSSSNSNSRAESVDDIVIAQHSILIDDAPHTIRIPFSQPAMSRITQVLQEDSHVSAGCLRVNLRMPHGGTVVPESLSVVVSKKIGAGAKREGIDVVEANNLGSKKNRIQS